jgi:hypothetical protein
MSEPDDLTEAEKDFRALLANAREYAKWAREVRSRWLRTPRGILAERVVKRWRADGPTRAGEETKEEKS